VFRLEGRQGRYRDWEVSKIVSKIGKAAGVCDWLGNTPKVAKKHYLQVTDEDFQRALLRCVPEQRAG
jgi:hypothetical protein